MKTLKQDWLIWIMLLIPFPFIAFFWEKFPGQIATRFDFDGNPAAYSGKVFGLFSMPLMNVALYFIFILLPFIDPRRKNYALFSDKYRILRVVLHAFLAFSFFISAVYALGAGFNMSRLIMYGVCVIMLILGNYMGNIRSNFFIGIRTPWTLSNEEVWTRTHRLAGKLWVAATLVMMMLLPILPYAETCFVIYISLITVVPVVYSFIIFRKLGA
jgi:uncharacterized membrane protein